MFQRNFLLPKIFQPSFRNFFENSEYFSGENQEPFPETIILTYLACKVHDQKH